MVNYTKIVTSNSIKETIDQNYVSPPLDRVYYKKGSGHLDLFRAAIYTFKEDPIVGHGIKNFFQSCIITIQISEVNCSA